MNEELKPGDVVYLKSGSQKMTVEMVVDALNVRIICMPYGSHTLTTATIAKAALRKHHEVPARQRYAQEQGTAPDEAGCQVQ